MDYLIKHYPQTVNIIEGNINDLRSYFPNSEDGYFLDFLYHKINNKKVFKSYANFCFINDSDFENNKLVNSYIKDFGADNLLKETFDYQDFCVDHLIFLLQKGANPQYIIDKINNNEIYNKNSTNILEIAKYLDKAYPGKLLFSRNNKQN